MLVTDAYILKGVPEFYETNIQECLQARTESLGTRLINKVTFREMGPPDLCHIIKTNPKSNTGQVGSYHFVLGVEATSSATFSAYINSLNYKLVNVSGKPNPWKITEGTYCCFNAFSRVDVRVEVKMPGGIQVYFVDLKGNRHSMENNDAIWQETHCSAILRAITDDHDLEPIVGLRRVPALPTVQSELMFLEVTAAEFSKGWQLGSDCLVQVPTITRNHLASGILNYFLGAGRAQDAAKYFEALYENDREIGSLLATAYIEGELQAVKILFESSKLNPVPYHVLLVQTDFLLSKGKVEKALVIARLAVTRAPSEYSVWDKLARVYIALEDYESALLALNTCTMYTFVDRDSHRLPLPKRTHLPIKADYLKSEGDFMNTPNFSGSVLESNDPAEDEIHPEISRLASRTLRGTFSKAYDLLIILSNKLGWDELLKYRTKVFVMEEEYRIKRSMNVENKKKEAEEVDSDIDDIETVGMENISLDDTAPKLSPGVKTEPEKVSANGNAFDQPMSGRATYNPRTPFTGVDFSFKHKRLCEKWLDNLFMVHYNDLRVYSAMKKELELFVEAEKNHDDKKPNPHRKTAAEWESYADLALKLNHVEDAKKGYEQALKQRLSLAALGHLIRIYEKEDHLIACLENIALLVSLLDQNYVDDIYPGPIATSLFRLIHTNGLTKVQNALVAMNIQPIIYRKVTMYFEYAELFRVSGCND